MHLALQIPELLHLIFSELVKSRSGHGSDIIACCLACKAFSEVALDLIWSNLPSIAVMPFRPYENVLHPNSTEFSEMTYFGHLERLKYYGRRVRMLQLHDKFTPELLKCITNLGYGSAPTHSLSPMLPILPSLQSLSLIFPTNGPHKNLVAHIQNFLFPTVKDLSLYFGANIAYDNPIDTLRAINTIQPSLTSLTLGPDIISDLLKPLPAALQAELVSLLNSLSQLEELQLPVYLVAHPVLAAIADIPALRRLKLTYPVHALWKHSLIVETCPLPLQTSGHGDLFPCLQSLAIVSTFDLIPRLLTIHERLTSHITSLFIHCMVPLPSSAMLNPLSSPHLSTHALQLLTHLSFDFVMPMPFHLDHSLDRRFFFPLLSASFISRLVSFHIRHRSPPIINDLQIEAIARAMPNLESLRFEVISHTFLLQGRTMSQQRIHASLAALLSFPIHCPKLREIALPLNAEEFPVPILPPTFEPAFAHPVDVDMSVSLVRSKVLLDTAKFLIAIFPHPNCRFTSYWESQNGAHHDEVGDVYAQHWKDIGELIRHEQEVTRVTIRSVSIWV